ncbi:MAG: hypothetical protein ACLFQV_07305 [Vulcanimicrobiota bacterium]
MVDGFNNPENMAPDVENSEGQLKKILITENKVKERDVLEFALDIYLFGMDLACLYSTKAKTRKKKITETPPEEPVNLKKEFHDILEDFKPEEAPVPEFLIRAQKEAEEKRRMEELERQEARKQAEMIETEPVTPVEEKIEAPAEEVKLERHEEELQVSVSTEPKKTEEAEAKKEAEEIPRPEKEDPRLVTVDETLVSPGEAGEMDLFGAETHEEVLTTGEKEETGEKPPEDVSEIPPEEAEEEEPVEIEAEKEVEVGEIKEEVPSAELEKPEETAVEPAAEIEGGEIKTGEVAQAADEKKVSWSDYVSQKGTKKSTEKRTVWTGFKQKTEISPDDWLHIMQGTAPPQKQDLPFEEKEAGISPVKSETRKPEVVLETETEAEPKPSVELEKPRETSLPVIEEAVEPASALEEEKPAVEEKTEEVEETTAVEKPEVEEKPGAGVEEGENIGGDISADDWMDIMQGKAPEPGSGGTAAVAPPAGSTSGEKPRKPDVEGPHLKSGVDYKATHYVPKRQTGGKVSRIEATRDGVTKREYFQRVKLRYKKSFTSSKKIPAKICASCLSGANRNACVVCGAPKASFMARLCTKCASDKKTANNCIICGKINARGIAKMCKNCAPGFSRVCVKCGARL